MQERLVTYDVMKFYGILLVVIGHIAMTYTPSSLITPAVSSSIMAMIKQGIYAFHMPMFVFVSGCIFAYQVETRGKKFTISGLAKNKAKRLMVPFYFFGFLWVLPVMCILGFRTPFHYAIDGFILAIDPRHLWYVMMLFEAFILLYVVRKLLVKAHIPMWGLLPIALCLYFAPHPVVYLQIGSLQEYFLWFVVGYLFICYQPAKKTLILVTPILLVLTFITPPLENVKL